MSVHCIKTVKGIANYEYAKLEHLSREIYIPVLRNSCSSHAIASKLLNVKHVPVHPDHP